MTRTLRSQVEEILDEVIDPCSAGMGIPVGLVSMGLIKKLDITDLSGGGKKVEVLMRLTSPCCMMAPHFAIEAEGKLKKLADIEEVKFNVCPKIDWEPSHMSEAFREKLARPDFMKPF